MSSYLNAKAKLSLAAHLARKHHPNETFDAPDDTQVALSQKKNMGEIKTRVLIKHTYFSKGPSLRL